MSKVVNNRKHISLRLSDNERNILLNMMSEHNYQNRSKFVRELIFKHNNLLNEKKKVWREGERHT